jgi:hypothetical protein
MEMFSNIFYRFFQRKDIFNDELSSKNICIEEISNNQNEKKSLNLEISNKIYRFQ